MSGVDSGKRLWEKSKSFPSTYEAYETIDVFQKDENYKALYYQLSNYGHPRPKTPAYPPAPVVLIHRSSWINL